MNTVADFIIFVTLSMGGILSMLHSRKLRKKEELKRVAALFLVLAYCYFSLGILLILDRQFRTVWPVTRMIGMLQLFNTGILAGLYLSMGVLGFIKFK